VDRTISKHILCIFCILNLWSCAEGQPKKNRGINSPPETEKHLPTHGHKISTRITPPQGFERIAVDVNSFQHYLRNLPLKPVGSQVKYFNGNTKPNNKVYAHVVDLDIGKKDLHQCADAVMRLRAEYLWHQKEYDKIHFNFTNGHKVEYKEWMSGKRMQVQGNKTQWIQKEEASNSYNDFWNYLELIFMYAGTASLEKEMRSRSINEAKVGDVLIQGGHPGHAVIIVDEVLNKENGNKLFLIAQSYMPAQEIQILVNQNNKKISPWHKLKEGVIRTPEWTFNSTDLKQFNN